MNLEESQEQDEEELELASFQKQSIGLSIRVTHQILALKYLHPELTTEEVKESLELGDDAMIQKVFKQYK